MGSRPSRAPLWILLLLAALIAFSLWLLDAPALPALSHGEPAPAPHLAFWAIVGTVASWIWKGIQVAGRLTLQALAFSVNLLWSFARGVYAAAKAVGRAFAVTGRELWSFLRSTYTHVLKPAWQHFWKWFDRARRWLEDIFRPVFEFLKLVKSELLGFYTKWVRPILDLIGIGRKVLRVLSSLGLDWARRLDQKLADLEERIDRPFRLALGKINEIINVINRIVTADGLFQRLALIRSIERDLREVSSAFRRWRSEPLTDDDIKRRREQRKNRTIEMVAGELKQALEKDDGPIASFADEHASVWARHFAKP